MVRVVFAGEVSGENGFVGHFRTLAGRRAMQKSSDSLSIGGAGPATAHPLTGGREKRKGWFICIYLMEGTMSQLPASNQQNMQ